jgi:hypothetical protein
MMYDTYLVERSEPEHYSMKKCECHGLGEYIVRRHKAQLSEMTMKWVEVWG